MAVKETNFAGHKISVLPNGIGNKTVGDYYYDPITSEVYLWDGTKSIGIGEFIPPPISSISIPVEKTDEELCAEHPGLADLKRELDEAQERYNAFKGLVK